MKESNIIQVALIGQPNVGKSMLFTRMTGVGVITSNYAGTTVEFDEATILRNKVKIHVHDLPGIYSLSKNSQDEDVAIKMLDDPDNDSIIVVADATDLESSLVLCFEVMELGLPVILALNKIDAARKKFDFDFDTLSKSMGVPVIPVSAKTAEGINTLLDAVCTGKAKVSDLRIKYDRSIDAAARSLSETIDNDRYNNYGIAIKMLEGTEDFRKLVSPDIKDNADTYYEMLTRFNHESPDVTIGRQRYALSDVLVREAVKRTSRIQSRADKLTDITITPITGVPILLAVFGMIFFVIVYLGSFLDDVVSSLYDWAVGNHLSGFVTDLDPFGSSVITAINKSISAILTLLIPYIMVFYIILGILEDSGYLTRIVVLLDTIMHRFGLHGGAAIPILVGLGCNVPAILATRTIQSRRERRIITSIIIMAVPCSAQMAIIMGITGKYAGIHYAFVILALLMALGCIIGILMNRFMKKEPSNLAMELPDLVMPNAKNVLFKTWDRIKDFFHIAFPLLVVGSIIVELLLTYDLLDFIVEPLSFITIDMLGLPSICIVAFIIGILRKEMAVGMLAVLGILGTMTPEQFVVFGVVMATYIPCFATLTVMWKELGWKDTIRITLTSCMIALLLGTLTNLMFIIF